MTPAIPRRSFFLQGSAALSAMALSSTQAATAPSNRVNLAVIGVGGRGRGLAASFAALPEARVATLCDIDPKAFPNALKEVADRQLDTPAPKIESDLRRVLDDPAIDAIVIATPDHWHALATIWACQAGKHVYVEKPASHSLWEGRKMVEAARKYHRVVQLGTQSRSAPHYLQMVEALRDGRIGEVHIAKAWNSQRRPDLTPQPDSTTPEGVDYNLWIGPAPERPFNPNRFHYAWHWQWDFGTGDVGNDGIHDLDIARWGLGVDTPTQVACSGGNFQNKNWQTPDTVYASFRFPDTARLLVYEQRDWSPYLQEGYENGAAFYGTKGYILAGRAGWQLFEGNNRVPIDSPRFSDTPHFQNWLDCIKTGARPHADIEEGHRSTSLAHLANISIRAGRCLAFDPATESIVGDSEAAALLRRSYREPFTVPDQV